MTARTVHILGATGSIGQSARRLLLRHPGRFRTGIVTGHNNIAGLAETAIALSAETAITTDSSRFQDLKDALDGTGIEAFAGQDALCRELGTGGGIVISAIMGIAGLKPTMAALEAGFDVALANKESLVCAGPLMTDLAKRRGVRLLPVDSEHSAIAQCLETAALDRGQVRRIILTASGGPFRGWSREELAQVTVTQALKHPNWSMGAKISIDSATLMNKGLELIEAVRLFDVAPDMIEPVVHPQSIVHSAVEYIDGSVIAQMGQPDMCGPIAYALGAPERIDAGIEPLDFTKLSGLTFEAPDHETFPLLNFARDCVAAGPSATIAMNAANEVAVAALLAGRIPFSGIERIVQDTVAAHETTIPGSIEDVLMCDAAARQISTTFIT